MTSVPSRSGNRDTWKFGATYHIASIASDKTAVDYPKATFRGVDKDKDGSVVLFFSLKDGYSLHVSESEVIVVV